MNTETALRLAGPGSHLAARPHGVLHVVPAGPLTPSGRFIPRSSRTVCRARHRRLTVVEHPPVLDDGQPGRRLCALCSARLGTLLIKVSSDQAGRAPHSPTGVNGGPGPLSPDGADEAPNKPKACQATSPGHDTPAPAGYLSRGDYRRRYAGLAALELALAAVTAPTTAEIDQVGHLSLLLLGH
ncbi:MAG TPA: hypothetical protein VFH56_14675, partial [Acidimicrobiales bacterium]|nr:hypothetical protein [Acidimicrobiales bacterium]